MMSYITLNSVLSVASSPFIILNDDMFWEMSINFMKCCLHVYYTQDKMTPLMYAAMEGHYSIAKLLFLKSTNPHLKNNVSLQVSFL